MGTPPGMIHGGGNRQPGRWNGYDQQSDFDWSVYGDNPYIDYVDQMKDWLSAAGNPFTTGYDPSNADGTWGTHVARPDDPMVGQYMAHVMGGQEKSLQDYVGRAAGAGIKRGGMNVAGGPALDSALHGQAMGTLAGGYADRFKSAMDYNKYYQGELQNSANRYRDDLIRGLGMQLQGLNAYGGWNERMGDRRYGEYGQNLNWRRGAEGRDQSRIGWNQQQDAQQRALTSDPIGRMYEEHARMNNLKNYFDPQSFGYPSFVEDWKTSKGYYQPLSRNLSVSFGGGGGGGGSGGGSYGSSSPGARTLTQGSTYDPYSNRTSYYPTYS